MNNELNTDLLHDEWQALGEQIQMIIQRHRSPELETSPDHLKASAQIEGFLEALRGMSAAWEDLVAKLPATGATDEEQDPEYSPSAIPQSQYWKPLVEALKVLGGSAPAKDAIAKVAELMADRLQDVDRELLRTGQIRWIVNTRFARNLLRVLGLIRDDKPGIWEFTEAGRRFADSNAEHLPNPVPRDDSRQLRLF
jgi:hypothetical protein